MFDLPEQLKVPKQIKVYQQNNQVIIIERWLSPKLKLVIEFFIWSSLFFIGINYFFVIQDVFSNIKDDFFSVPTLIFIGVFLLILYLWVKSFYDIIAILFNCTYIIAKNNKIVVYCKPFPHPHPFSERKKEFFADDISNFDYSITYTKLLITDPKFGPSHKNNKKKYLNAYKIVALTTTNNNKNIVETSYSQNAFFIIALLEYYYNIDHEKLISDFVL